MKDLKLMKVNLIGCMSDEVYISEEEKHKIESIKKEYEEINPSIKYFILDYNLLTEEEKGNYNFI